LRKATATYLNHESTCYSDVAIFEYITLVVSSHKFCYSKDNI